MPCRNMQEADLASFPDFGIENVGPCFEATSDFQFFLTQGCIFLLYLRKQGFKFEVDAFSMRKSQKEKRKARLYCSSCCNDAEVFLGASYYEISEIATFGLQWLQENSCLGEEKNVHF